MAVKSAGSEPHVTPGPKIADPEFITLAAVALLGASPKNSIAGVHKYLWYACTYQRKIKPGAGARSTMTIIAAVLGILSRLSSPAVVRGRLKMIARTADRD